jgi:hypothetical protein
MCLLRGRDKSMEFSLVLNKTGRWIMSRIVIVMLIYHRHKPTDSINLLDSYRRRNVFSERDGQTYKS